MSKLITFIKRIIHYRSTHHPTEEPLSPDSFIIPRHQHRISRKMISDNALKVLYRLQDAGFDAFLVGGSVRDCLLGYKPKDFDIATNAQPEQVRRIFRNCRLIGRRFRLAHVYFRQEIIEVATFRAGDEAPDEHERSEQGVIVRDNVYGTLEDDIWRRDFTVNALYYNVADFSVIDKVGGMHDLRQGIIRIIGDASTRYREDPVRMIRAVRFAAKLNFTIEPHTAEPILACHDLLTHISNARLFDECVKLFLTGHSGHAYRLLRQYHLFGSLFPTTDACLNDPEWHPKTQDLIFTLLDNTDRQLAEEKPVSTTFIFAVLLWQPIKKQQLHLCQAYNLTGSVAFEQAIQDVLTEQTKCTAMPRRMTASMREIYSMQHALSKQGTKRSFKLIHSPRFRAGFDFLALCAQADPTLQKTVDWWLAFTNANEQERKKMCRHQRTATRDDDA